MHIEYLGHIKFVFFKRKIIDVKKHVIHAFYYCRGCNGMIDIV